MGGDQNVRLSSGWFLAGTGGGGGGGGMGDEGSIRSSLHRLSKST